MNQNRKTMLMALARLKTMVFEEVVEPFNATLDPYTKELISLACILSQRLVEGKPVYPVMQKDFIAMFKEFTPVLRAKGDIVEEVTQHLKGHDSLAEAIYLGYLLGVGMPREEYLKHVFIQQVEAEVL